MSFDSSSSSSSSSNNNNNKNNHMALRKHAKGNGILAIVDLPLGTSLSMDGKVLVLKHGDFVGFDVIPSKQFHLVTIQAAAAATTTTTTTSTSSNHHDSQEEHSGRGMAPPRHGFVLFCNHNNDNNDDHDHDDDAWIVGRRFDGTTEEVSGAEDSMDSQTIVNLQHMIRQNQMEPHRVIPYHRLHAESELEIWTDMTCFIDNRLLKKRGVQHGQKVVPGPYHGDDDVTLDAINNNNYNNNNNYIIDGTPIQYPPILVISESQQHLRHTSHVGTKNYLSNLAPTRRTEIFRKGPSAALSSVLETNYEKEWKLLLGDLQLSYVLFLHLHCLLSLEHWRDLVAMLCFASESITTKTSSSSTELRKELYTNFVRILAQQMKYMDRDFFEDAQFSGGNFLLPAVKQLIKNVIVVSDPELHQSAAALETAALTLFPSFNNHISTVDVNDDDDDHNNNEEGRYTPTSDMDDDDGPMVVSTLEYEAAMSRSETTSMSCMVNNNHHYHHQNNIEQYPAEHRTRYPFLFAAMQPHEDILMTCARVLDAQTDVSLVREAADYLETVENFNS